MPKNKEQKREILENLKDKISRSKSVVFTKFSKLGVSENETLRNELKKEDSEYYVAKKTLMDIAFKDAKIDNLDIKGFEGQVAAVFGYKDEVAPAKVVNSFRKKLEDKEKVLFLGGILENKFIDAAGINNLASLPSKQELYAKIVGSINAPVFGFVNVLAGNLRKFVYALKAIEEKKK